MTTKSKESATSKLPENPEQSKRFEETARQLEADESGRQFQRAMKAVVPPKTASRSKKAAQGSNP